MIAVSCSLPSVPPPVSQPRPRRARRATAGARAMLARPAVRRRRWFASEQCLREHLNRRSAGDEKALHEPVHSRLAPYDRRMFKAFRGIEHGAAAMPGTILVIEDEPGIVDFLERGLRAHGFDVSSALDGAVGTEKALRDDVDLVVLDMMLPGRSGLEVLATLHDAKPTLPVIVLTARGEVEDRVSGLDAGAVDYLTKPFSLSELAARIRAQLRVASQMPQTTLEGGDVEVNLITREVRRRRKARPALDDRVRAARLPAAQPRPGALARADPARRVGLRVRPGHERGRRLCRLPAPQAARRRGQGSDRHGALGRLSLRCDRIRAAAAVRPALAADGVGGGGDARLRGGRVRRRLPQHRDADPRPDRPRHRRRHQPARAGAQAARGAERPREIAAAADAVRPRPAVHRDARRCCSCSCPAPRPSATTPRCSAASGPDAARPRPSRRARTPRAQQLRAPQLGYSVQPVPDVGRMRRARARRPGRPDPASWSGPASRWRSSSARSTASRARSCWPAR